MKNQNFKVVQIWQCGTYFIKDGKEYKLKTSDLCKQAKMANIDFKGKR